VIADLLEQLWCQAKAQRVSTEISQAVDSVSRPWSALNRLGSYIRWEQKYFEGQDEYRLKAEEGYIWNDQSKVFTIISSEKGVNVPLQKTLNYLSKVNLK
jgi:hypothetical protein